VTVSLSTPWHRDDLNARLKTGGAFASFRRAVGPNLEPVWPEHWSSERLGQRRGEIGSVAFARAYQLQPLVEEDAAIPARWIRFWQEPPVRYEQVLLSIDPAISLKPQADRTAFVQVGLRDDGHWDVLHAFARRLRPALLSAMIDECDAGRRSDIILFEANGAFAAVFDMLRQEPRLAGRLQSHTAVDNKESRLTALGVQFERGRVRLKGRDAVDADQQELWDELTAFPHGDHDDLADALASALRWFTRHPPIRIW
jgi:predicted phage terminase large subunit-like protein